MLTIKTQNLVKRALKAMENESPKYYGAFTCADAAKNHCLLKLSDSEKEKFLVIFLNSQHELIKSEIMFHGTIDSASVYPREIVKRALELNAKAIIISHNHPSGISTPSQADKSITRRIKNSCELLDINLLDHIVVGGSNTSSLAQEGLI